MKRILPLLLAACLLLCACGSKDPQPESTASQPTQTTAAPTTVPPTTKAPAPTAEPTVPEVTMEVVRFRHPLNGSPIQQPYTGRPVAISLNNIIYAMPACSVGQADMLFELLAEGGITRCVAIFDDVAGVHHIGPVRSARPHLVQVAESFDAIFVHHGGSHDGYDETDYVANLDAMRNAGYAFYRDQERLDSGKYDLEHTSFTDGDELLKAADNRGYDLENEESVDFGFHFDNSGSTGSGTTAEKVHISFGGDSKVSDFVYDKNTGLYTAYQYDGPYIDGNSFEPVTFRNLICISTSTHTYCDVNEVWRLNVTMQGEGEGVFVCDGKMVPIRWSRSDRQEPFCFTMEDGTPITLGVGTTYVGITPLSGEVTCQ